MDIWTSEHDEWMSVDYYFDMIGRKTASLIAGSAEAGAVLASDDEAIIGAYRRFGWALGLAFQLNDDLLGIWGDEGHDRQGDVGRRPPARRRCRSSTPWPKPPAQAAGCARCWPSRSADPWPSRGREVLAILGRVGRRTSLAERP